MIIVTPVLSLREDEIHEEFSRSSGPGGQNVNKVNTKVFLRFDVVNSPSLSDEQKQLVLARLSNRITKEGSLFVIAQQTRSQATNRELALERLVELLREALKQNPTRKKTRVGKGAKERRLEEKKRHSIVKRGRSKGVPGED